MPGTNHHQAGTRRAAIYARVSDKSQDTDDKTSIGEQLSDMEAYCEERGLVITARYQEVGRGWSKQRPEFQRMLADASAGRFDTIVCWKSDRLSRGMYPAAALMEVVEAQRIGIEAVMDAIDMKTFGLMAAIGKIELDNFRERSSMGKRGTAKQGRIPVNHVPDGYRIAEGRTPEIDEERAEVIRRIFRHSVHDGMGAPAIAEALEADGVPTARPGARWHAAQVNRILRNEAYKGTWWYGKVRHPATDAGMLRHTQPRERWIGVPFPPLVDEETWERAQALRRRRLTRSPRNTKTFHLLQHLVRCSECGMLMGPNVVRSQSVRKGGKTYRYELDPPRRYYQCYGMRTHHLRCREHPSRSSSRPGRSRPRPRRCWSTRAGTRRSLPSSRRRSSRWARTAPSRRTASGNGRCSRGPSSWPGSRTSRRSASGATRLPRVPCSSGRWTASARRRWRARPGRAIGRGGLLRGLRPPLHTSLCGRSCVKPESTNGQANWRRSGGVSPLC